MDVHMGEQIPKGGVVDLVGMKNILYRLGGVSYILKEPGILLRGQVKVFGLVFLAGNDAPALMFLIPVQVYIRMGQFPNLNHEAVKLCVFFAVKTRFHRCLLYSLVFVILVDHPLA
jgi:hypothetical protein